jgi:peptidoglycan/LPS O-acetylase OafA/YrhL
MQFDLGVAGYPFAGWLFRPGWLAVDIFFMLSGYVITAVHRDLTLPGVGDFFIRRVFRIYPMHLAVLAAIVALTVWSEGGFLAHGAYDRWRDLPIVALLLGPYFIHGLTWNIVSWSVAVELPCYLLFPLAIMPLRRLETIGTAAILLAAATIEWHVESAWVWGWPALARALAGFALGMVLQQMSGLVPRPGVRSASLVEVGALLGAVLAIASGHIRFVPLCGAALIWALGSEHGIVAGLLRARGCVWLGRISFSVYLLHPTLIGLAFVWMPPARLPFGHQAQAVIWGAGVVALILAVATITFHGIEEPARRFGIRLARRVARP